MPIEVVKHPLIRHKLGIMRDKLTSTAKFRDLTREITNLLAYEAFRHLEMEDIKVSGWAGQVTTEAVSGKKVAVVPVLRAGMGMLQGVLDLIPSARVNVVGFYRNEETLEPVSYFQKLSSDISERQAVILDPMLATGNSMLAAIDLLLQSGCSDLKAICLVAAPEGVQNIQDRHPGLTIYAASLDERLDDKGYILPGLGDAGDRLFGTR